MFIRASKAGFIIAMIALKLAAAMSSSYVPQSSRADRPSSSATAHFIYSMAPHDWFRRLDSIWRLISGRSMTSVLIPTVSWLFSQFWITLQYA